LCVLVIVCPLGSVTWIGVCVCLWGKLLVFCIMRKCPVVPVSAIVVKLRGLMGAVVCCLDTLLLWWEYIGAILCFRSIQGLSSPDRHALFGRLRSDPPIVFCRVASRQCSGPGNLHVWLVWSLETAQPWVWQ
jgi:hypothetical protein